MNDSAPAPTNANKLVLAGSTAAAIRTSGEPVSGLKGVPTLDEIARNPSTVSDLLSEEGRNLLVRAAVSSIEIMMVAHRPQPKGRRVEVPSLPLPFGRRPPVTNLAADLKKDTAKGYDLEQFQKAEVFERYLGPEKPPQKPENVTCDGSGGSCDGNVTAVNSRKPAPDAGCDGVTAGKGGRPGNIYSPRSGPGKEWGEP